MMIDIKCADCGKIIASVDLDLLLKEREVQINACYHGNPEKYKDYELPAHLRNLRFA